MAAWNWSFFSAITESFMNNAQRQLWLSAITPETRPGLTHASTVTLPSVSSHMGIGGISELAGVDSSFYHITTQLSDGEPVTPPPGHQHATSGNTSTGTRTIYTSAMGSSTSRAPSFEQASANPPPQNNATPQTRPQSPTSEHRYSNVPSETSEPTRTPQQGKSPAGSVVNNRSMSLTWSFNSGNVTMG